MENKSGITIVNIKHNVPYDVYIGRYNKWLNLQGSKWGNPFVMKNESQREEVLKKYKEYILSNTDLLNDLHELKYKTLACYCHPKKCHGDILKELLEESFNL